METIYAIEFMRLAEPPLTPIKQPSAFHVALLCARPTKLQTLSQQVRTETAAIQSGIPHRKQRPPRKASRPRR